jgi:CBS domain-containing protein
MNEPLDRLLDQKTETLETVTPSTSVLDAVARMNFRHIGSLLVMEGERLVGIFTERDVLTRVVPRNLDPAKTPVSDVMTREVITVAPSTSVQQAMMIVTETRRRHLPVVQGGKVLGLVSIGDLTRWVVRDQQYTIDGLFEYVRRG